MRQTIAPEKRTFICIGPLDECVAEHRVKLLNSLDQMLKKSPGTQIFVTRRPYIQIGECFSGKVTTIGTTSKQSGIIRYLYTGLNEGIIQPQMR